MDSQSEAGGKRKQRGAEAKDRSKPSLLLCGGGVCVENDACCGVGKVVAVGRWRRGDDEVGMMMAWLGPLALLRTYYTPHPKVQKASLALSA